MHKNSQDLNVDQFKVGLLDDDFFKEVAVQIRVELGWGRERIKTFMDKKYGDLGFAYSDKTIEIWYKEVKKGPGRHSRVIDFHDFGWSNAPRLARIDLIKQAVTNGGRLTQIEAITAIRFAGYFDIPNREPLDMYAQYAVVDAYSRRQQAGTETTDLDALLTYQPWNPLNTDLYRLSLETGKAPIPRISQLTEYVRTNRFVPHTAIIAAYAQMRMPFLTMFYTADGHSGHVWTSTANGIPDGGIYPDTTFEDRAVFHTWRDHVRSLLTGETVTINTGFTPKGVL